MRYPEAPRRKRWRKARRRASSRGTNRFTTETQRHGEKRRLGGMAGAGSLPPHIASKRCTQDASALKRLSMTPCWARRVAGGGARETPKAWRAAQPRAHTLHKKLGGLMLARTAEGGCPTRGRQPAAHQKAWRATLAPHGAEPRAHTFLRKALLAAGLRPSARDTHKRAAAREMLRG